MIGASGRDINGAIQNSGAKKNNNMSACALLTYIRINMTLAGIP